jgi:hypothetical protein
MMKRFALASLLASVATLSAAPAGAAVLTAVGEVGGVDSIFDFNTATGNVDTVIDVSSLITSGNLLRHPLELEL